MTLAKRVIPTMLCRHRSLTKGKRFRGDRSIGHVAQAARVHAKRGVDELVILDIAASQERRVADAGMVMTLSLDLFVPLSVGGGIRTVYDIDLLLRSGADKVVLGDSAVNNRLFLRAASERFGRQALVVSVDFGEDGFVRTECGAVSLHLDPVSYAKRLEDDGAGEILLQAVDRDGEMTGYDLGMIERVSEAVNIPVIASGGCSGPDDMLRAIERGASAVAAGALFAYTDWTPRSCAEWLAGKGVEVRL